MAIVRDLVTLRQGEKLQFNGPVTPEYEITDGKVTAVWLTDGIARYLIQGVFSGWLELYQPREQAQADTLDPCLATVPKASNLPD